MGAQRLRKLRSLAVPVVSSPNSYCEKATVILNCAHESASSLLNLFELLRAKRGAGTPRGMTTDEEQDLLRAMLVMAAAGVDAMIKQLIRDSLPALVMADPKVKEGLESFVSGQIRGEERNTPSGRKFLAKVLAAPSHQAQVIEEYIGDLTGGSLQSADSVLSTANALGIAPKSLGVDPKALKKIFDIHNDIIHELDINLEAERRIRNLRSRSAMIASTDDLFKVAANMRDAVDKTLAAISPPIPTPPASPRGGPSRRKKSMRKRRPPKPTKARG